MAKKHPSAPAAPVAAKGDFDPVLKAQLRHIRLRLQNVYAVLVTVNDALRVDQVERNADYARCLLCGALDPLDDQIVELEELDQQFAAWQP